MTTSAKILYQKRLIRFKLFRGKTNKPFLSKLDNQYIFRMLCVYTIISVIFYITILNSCQCFVLYIAPSSNYYRVGGGTQGYPRNPNIHLNFSESYKEVCLHIFSHLRFYDLYRACSPVLQDELLSLLLLFFFILSIIIYITSSQ